MEPRPVPPAPDPVQALFDTHVHLLDEQFDADREAVLAALPAAGVTRALEACCGEGDIDAIVALCEAHPLLFGSAGVHPHAAGDWNDGTAARLLRALEHPKLVAIGEIGLDYHYDFAPRDVQKRVFAAQLELAAAARVPVLVHDREAHGDCMDLLRAFRGRLSGVMHCFSGSYETARECIDAGLHIAFGGALTFKNASTRRDIAARLPLDRLLLETDCPYMAPEPFRGTRNDPRRVRQVLEVLAAVRQQPLETVAAATTENALRLFRLAGA